MSTTADFEAAYQRLNPTQRQAVDLIEGPVLVLAGPGTGKTQVLTVRIANILKNTDTEPSSILALTFTEAAAKEMRDRLVRLIGKDGYYVKISTFHSFCADVINEHPERFGRAKNLQIATDLEKIQIITDILESNHFLLLKPLNDPLYYLSSILKNISDLKREGITIDNYRTLVTSFKDSFEVDKVNLKKTALLETEKHVHKNLDLLNIYEQYHQKLSELGRYDFDDMINWVVIGLETDQDFALIYQERYQYILADEYQDTNSSQNRLLFALTQYWGLAANIFVVGDPNQSIFRFQGASRENLLQYRSRFPQATEVSLTENYRSTPNILISSAKLIGEKALNHHIDLPDKKIKVAAFSSPIFEEEFLARSIKTKIKNGISPHDIAVIVKENKDIERLTHLLKHNNIPYKLQNGSDVIRTPLVSQFIKLLTLVATLPSSSNDLDLFTILNYPYFKLDPLSILKISRLANQTKTTLFDLLSDHSSNVPKDIRTAFQKFISWNHQSAVSPLPEIFQIILQESGVLDYILSSDRCATELNRFSTLFEDVKSQSSAFPGLRLTDYVRNLTVMSENNIRLEEQAATSVSQAVTLTTAHKSKGLEWQVVYIYKFVDGYWSNKGDRQMIKPVPGILLHSDSEDKLAEERRLFYVALTRAKQQIYLLGSKEYPGESKTIFPSLFIHDLPRTNTVKIKTKNFEKQVSQYLTNRLKPPIKSSTSSDEIEVLSDIIQNLKLSPTSLNTYLQCRYKFKLDNLYKIPRAKAPVMSFGTAVHFALERLYLQLNQGTLETKENFLSDFAKALKKEVMSDHDFKERLNHGQKILSGYYDFYEQSFSPALFIEKKFGHSTVSPIFLDDISLTGKADRIDLLNSQNKTVRFVDYKTGRVKTRGEIEGTTKNSDGSYKRQLVFYRLLAELDKTFPYTVVETELDFVEPKSGVYQKEKFLITDQDIDDLKTLIRSSVQAIREHRFERTTDTSICERCDFLSHCWPNGLPTTSQTTA